MRVIFEDGGDDDPTEDAESWRPRDNFLAARDATRRERRRRSDKITRNRRKKRKKKKTEWNGKRDSATRKSQLGLIPNPNFAVQFVMMGKVGIPRCTQNESLATTCSTMPPSSTKTTWTICHFRRKR